MRQNTTVFWGDNPSQMYLEALLKLIGEGKESGPRGKRTKELRPVIFEYHNPKQRVTFLKGRVINPFFQLAEALWIVTGRSDVKWLTDYNASIAQFSDDGEFFNAPYGERLRHWGKNDTSKTLINPLDQLHDVYLKMKEDPETRQAVAFIGNPHFDNSEYTLKGGKDIACNINIKFKIRDNKLDVSVDNRSNDLHWGVFGANLAQFSTIQEIMASWLGVEVGTYYQVSDSLHIYLDEYGAKETDKVLNAYTGNGTVDIDLESIKIDSFLTETEPRFNSSYEEFDNIIKFFYTKIEPVMITDALYTDLESVQNILDGIASCPDEYLKFTFQSMLVKQAHNRGLIEPIIQGLKEMADCSWKISCMRFLFRGHGHKEEFISYCEENYEGDVLSYIRREDVR